MPTTRPTHLAALTVMLMALALLPVFADELTPAAQMANAFAALQEQVQQQSWPAVAQQAQALLTAAAMLDPASLTAEQLYRVGVAHYWLMGLALQAALQGDTLSPEQAEFARKMVELTFTATAPETIKVIGHGERVTLEEHLTPGKTVIVDFFSEFCPPCMAIAPHLERLVQARSDLVLVKVDINRPGHQGIDWESPVARQFDLQSIPHFRIYDGEGKLTAEGDQARAIIVRWLQEL